METPTVLPLLPRNFLLQSIEVDKYAHPRENRKPVLTGARTCGDSHLSMF